MCHVLTFWIHLFPITGKPLQLSIEELVVVTILIRKRFCIAVYFFVELNKSLNSYGQEINPRPNGESGCPISKLVLSYISYIFKNDRIVLQGRSPPTLSSITLARPLTWPEL